MNVQFHNSYIDDILLNKLWNNWRYNSRQLMEILLIKIACFNLSNMQVKNVVQGNEIEELNIVSKTVF